MIPMCRLWLLGLYGLYGPHCPLSWKGHQNLITHSLGAVRQQAITWANVHPDLCRHMVSLGQNELMVILGGDFARFLQYYPACDSMHGCPCQCCLLADWAARALEPGNPQNSRGCLQHPTVVWACGLQEQGQDYSQWAYGLQEQGQDYSQWANGLQEQGQDYSQLYSLRMSTLTHWLLDTLRTYYPKLTWMFL